MKVEFFREFDDVFNMYKVFLDYFKLDGWKNIVFNYVYGK